MKPDIAANNALAWFEKNLIEQRIAGAKIQSILTTGKWRTSWKDDFIIRHNLKFGELHVDAVLSLYEDAAQKNFGYMKHMCFYLEVTKDQIKEARDRMTLAGFKEVTVLADDHQRYILARKQGR